ncbi:MAG: hypothetical protein PHH54_06445 [Candidatus Nanoarchaeia archaeon]|nr:hypothetical protein [Candidatus Nanoarchaeia archaeon]MDD5741595.1 hypothetical protein [Candidatus Nanoarchaeia archaeon]
MEQRKSYTGELGYIEAITHRHINSNYQLVKGTTLLKSGDVEEDVCLFLKSKDNFPPFVKYTAWRLKNGGNGLFKISPLFAVSGVGAVLDDSYLDLESIFEKGFEGRCMKPTFNAYLREIDKTAESYLIVYGSPSKLKETKGDRYFLEMDRFVMDNTKNIINPNSNDFDKNPTIEISAEEPQLIEKGLGILVRSARPEDITAAVILNSKLNRGEIANRVKFYQNKFNGHNLRFVDKTEDKIQ